MRTMRVHYAAGVATTPDPNGGPPTAHAYAAGCGARSAHGLRVSPVWADVDCPRCARRRSAAGDGAATGADAARPSPSSAASGAGDRAAVPVNGAQRAPRRRASGRAVAGRMSSGVHAYAAPGPAPAFVLRAAARRAAVAAGEPWPAVPWAPDHAPAGGAQPGGDAAVAGRVADAGRVTGECDRGRGRGAAIGRGARPASPDRPGHAGISARRVAASVREIVCAVERGEVGRLELGDGAAVELRELNAVGARSVWALDAGGRATGDGIIVPLVQRLVDLERPRQLTVLRAVARRALIATLQPSAVAGSADRIATLQPSAVAGTADIAAPPLVTVGGDIAPGRDGALFEFAWA